MSPACKNCYAEAWSRRVGRGTLWGSRSDRRFFSDRHWDQPRKWDEEARSEGKYRRVFCASMADVFEARVELNPWRERLWQLIARTPNLQWLLLTKRPESLNQHLPDWPFKNVWLGTTVENQRWADERLPHLAKRQAAVRFLSCEPLLGPIDLSRWLKLDAIDWVIVGGESGPKARPTDPRWVLSLRDQCTKFGVAFHFKQWGHWAPYPPVKKGTGKKISLQIGDERIRLWRHSKKGAGRRLAGRTWDEVPIIEY